MEPPQRNHQLAHFVNWADALGPNSTEKLGSLISEVTGLNRQGLRKSPLTALEVMPGWPSARSLQYRNFGIPKTGWPETPNYQPENHTGPKDSMQLQLPRSARRILGSAAAQGLTTTASTQGTPNLWTAWLSRIGPQYSPRLVS